MSEENQTEKEKDIDQSIQEVSEKLHIDVNVLRMISPEEIQYILDRCPFLQVLGPDFGPDQDIDFDKPVEIVSSRSGWDIHDYHDALSSSPGRLLFGGGNYRIYLDDEEDEGGGGDIINPGKGTIINQAFVTAAEMIEMAYERGWREIAIADGHNVMKRAAWIKAQEYGDMTIEGYEPTSKEKAQCERVRESAEQFRERKTSTRPKK